MEHGCATDKSENQWPFASFEIPLLAHDHISLSSTIRMHEGSVSRTAIAMDTVRKQIGVKSTKRCAFSTNTVRKGRLIVHCVPEIAHHGSIWYSYILSHLRHRYQRRDRPYTWLLAAMDDLCTHNTSTC